MSSSVHDIVGQKLFDGKTKTIYSMIDQPGLICIHRKDYYQSSGKTLSIPGSRRGSTDSAVRFNQAGQKISNSYLETPGKGILTTSITVCVYEILREASIPTFFVATHRQPDMFIARKCIMIPILWIVRRIANDSYVKRNPGIISGHRFVPPVVEIYYKRHPLIYRRMTFPSVDESLESSRDSLFDDEDSDYEECLSSIWSYEQLLNGNFELEDMKITQNEIEYMYETCCAIFDILEHVWMVKKNCQLIDLKLEFGITTTSTKEIVLANIFDIETWHILRPVEKSTSKNDIMQENLIWINDALKDILNMNNSISLQGKFLPRRRSCAQFKPPSTIDDVEIDDDKPMVSIVPENDYIDIQKDILSPNMYSSSFASSITSHCVIVCSSPNELEQGQKLKCSLNENYNIQCDVRLCSVYKSTQAILKFLSHCAFEHGRPTVFVTLGNINNGLAMYLSSNTQYPVIHCSLVNAEQQHNLFDINSYLLPDTSMFTIVFTLSSAIQNVVQILALTDWRLWAKQRGRRLKNHIDLLIADQQLTTVANKQTKKTNTGLLTNK